MTKDNGDGVLNIGPRRIVNNDSGGPPEEERSNFMAFGAAIRTGDVVAAGKHLSSLMDLSDKDGLAAARFFQKRMQTDPETISKTMQIRGAIAEGKTNSAMAALMECFGLDSLRAMAALQALQRMLE